jgi:hypothetical protein
MRWYLIVKDDEYRLGWFTETRKANEQSHGWRVVTSWPLQPTNLTVTETIYIDQIIEETIVSQSLQSKIAKAQQRVAEQRKWIEQCGGSLSGYILRYGAADDPNKSGDGGQAIWNADEGELQKLLSELRTLQVKAARKS